MGQDTVYNSYYKIVIDTVTRIDTTYIIDTVVNEYTQIVVDTIFYNNYYDNSISQKDSLCHKFEGTIGIS